MNLILQPFGHIDSDVIAHLKKGLAKDFSRVSAKKELPIPEYSYDVYRKQYLVDDFFTLLKDVKGKKVMGIVDRDLYSPELNFILGKGMINGRRSIIAIYRLRAGATKQMFLDRVLKEALHNLGHTDGLRHCQDKFCVMYNSDTLADTDLKSFKHCRKCRKLL